MMRIAPADSASQFCILFSFGPTIRKNAGAGVLHMTATLSTIGAAKATTARASERDQPPTPRLSIGTFSIVQPISAPPTNAFALTETQNDTGVSFVRTVMAAAKTRTANKMPAPPCQSQNGWL